LQPVVEWLTAGASSGIRICVKMIILSGSGEIGQGEGVSSDVYFSIIIICSY
jgi:hypothetical protein